MYFIAELFRRCVSLKELENASGGGRRADPPHQVMIEGHYRGLGAGAEAGVEPHRKAMVGTFTFAFQPRGFQDGVNHAHCAHEVAGRPPAHFYLAFRRRLKAKVWVERRDCPDIVDRGIHVLGHYINSLAGNVVEFVFYSQQG